MGTDALEIILLQSTVVADATMRDYATVAAILAGNTESTALNYVRLLASSISIVTSNASDNTTFTFANPTWTSLGNASSVAHNALIVAYRPTSGAADSAKIPLSKHDISFTPNGTNATATISTVVATAA